MPIRAIDHINITGPRPMLEACVAFYTEILGLTVGHRPPFRSQGFWLYAGDAPILHLTQAGEGEPGVSGPFNHVAFACEDFDDAQRKLEAHGIPFSMSGVPGTTRVQLFLTDPAGLPIELNFHP